MRLGNRIKFHRLNNNLTQQELADGIISKSYLSKIENNQTIPAQEIIELLFEKLGIPYEEDNQEDILGVFQQWSSFLIKGAKNEAKSLYKKVEETFKDVHNPELIKLYEIHKVRFYIIINELHNAKQKIEELKQFYSDYTSTEKYYWCKFLGDYHYATLTYQEAFYHYREAEQYIENIKFLYEEEQRELYYLIALTSSQLWKYHLSIHYAETALLHYQNAYELHRCAQCHLIIGITYKRMGELKKALESYQKTYKIANSLSDQTLLATFHQNIGSLYYQKGQLDKAIKEYIKSYQKKSDLSPEKKLVTVVSLIKLYYQNNEFEEAKEWISIGQKLCSENENETLSLDLRLYNFMISDSDESFEQFMINEAFPLLLEKRRYKEMAYYYKVFADYNLRKRKYKDACFYYQKSLKKSNYNISLEDKL